MAKGKSLDNREFCSTCGRAVKRGKLRSGVCVSCSGFGPLSRADKKASKREKLEYEAYQHEQLLTLIEISY